MMETNAPTEIHTPRANPWESCATMPPALPETLDGWRRRMSMHISKAGGHAASFTIYDDRGNLTPICYEYDLAPGGVTGFSLPPVGGFDMPPGTWDQLRAAWPEWLAAKRAAAGIRG